MEMIVVSIVILLALLLLGIPVPLAFGGTALFLVGVRGYDVWGLLPPAVDQTTSVLLFAIPLFILAGSLMETGDIAPRMVNLASVLTGRIKGGLGAASVVACGLFGAVSGSALAGLSAVGGIMIPHLKEQGYPEGTPEALLSVAAILTLLIPPSIDMIIFGWMTGTSVPACFLATVGPGILIIGLLIFTNFLAVRRVTTLKSRPPISFSATLKEIGAATRRGALALGMPIIILGGIYGGIFTPTEAAAVACFYALVVGFIYRRVNLKSLKRVLVTTGTTTGVVMLMFFFVVILSRIYTLENVPKMIAAGLLGISTNPYIILSMVLVLLIITGMLVGDTPGLLLVTPLLFPVMLKIGVHPIHFAAIIGVAMGMGAVTPPAAPLLYLGLRIGGITIDKIMKPLALFLVVGFLPGLVATVFWPELSLFLPRLLGFVS